MVSNDVADLNGLPYNSDTDLAEITLFGGCTDTLLQFAYACCVIFILVGIPGNLITIIAFAICEKFRNATAYFIINLHINNLVYCCVILPMIAAIFSTKHWSFGVTMCSVFPFMKYVLVGIAHLNVVAISVNRYIIVCYPHIYHRLCKRSILIATLLFIWVAPVIIFLPTFFKLWGRFDLEPMGGSCTIVPDIKNRSPKTFFICFAFLGPYLIIILCYARIWWTVRQVVRKQNDYNTRTVHVNESTSDSSAINSEAHQELANTNTMNNAHILTKTVPNSEEKVVVRNFQSFSLRKKNNELRLPTRKDKKLATMIVAILVAFMLCHLPLMLTRVLYGDYKSNPKVNILAHLTEYSTAFISPIIYVMMSREYRQVYEILFKVIQKNTVNPFI